MKEDRLVHNGKEYLSRQEFAKRVGCSLPTIDRYLRAGKLVYSDPQKKGQYYLEWTSQSVMYEQARRQKNNKTPKAKRYVKASGSVKTPTVDNIELPSVDEPDVNDIQLSELVFDTANFDYDAHKDCWMMQDSDNPMRDADGKPLIDWEKFKNKVSSLTIQFKLDKEMGKLIPKEEQVFALNGILRILKTMIDSIPNKYASVLIARAESLSGHEFNTQEQTQIRNDLRKVPIDLFENVQSEIEKLKEGTYDPRIESEQSMEVIRIMSLLSKEQVKFIRQKTKEYENV